MKRYDLPASLDVVYTTDSLKVIALRETRYGDGSLAMVAEVLWSTGLREDVVISVNLIESSDRLTDGEFFLRSFADGAPLALALIESSIVRPTGKYGFEGEVSAPVVRVADWITQAVVAA